jgi:hypothetical protein
MLSTRLASNPFLWSSLAVPTNGELGEKAPQGLPLLNLSQIPSQAKTKLAGTEMRDLNAITIIYRIKENKVLYNGIKPPYPSCA